jgi:DNA-directed RNA polymerase specialized sigma24 family protein
MALFFPGLGRLCRRCSGWEVDVDELWHVITVVFIEVLRRIDPVRRTERIAQKLMNDTAHHLHDEYRRRWRRSAVEAPVEPETLLELMEERQAEECCRETSSGALARFDEQIRLGVIGKSDGELILQTRVQGVGLREFSQRSGISVQALKKRRLRAEARLRKNWFNA